MKRIGLEEVLRKQRDLPYEEQYRYVRRLLKEERIRPVKASGTNGKKPALYREYWLLEEEKEYGALQEELQFQISPLISVDYYLKHLDIYAGDRPWVLLLNQYLKTHRENLEHPESVNERSFEIWGREKFLSREQGRRILKRCGLEEEFLNVYYTSEPLAYYSHTREVPQNLLILENKDTFYSMRSHLLAGRDTILGMKTGTLIYGAGKGIFRSFGDFDRCVEPYMKAPGNQIYYFGDLDYEGIGIYEKLAGMFEKSWEIRPFLPAYLCMLGKVEDAAALPDTKEKQNRNMDGRFFSYFPEYVCRQIQEILEKEKYLPQEILNITDF